MKYVVVDVGCIECGEESAVLGIFTDKKKAEEIMKKCEEYQSAHWMGQHYFFIEEIKEENELANDYYKERINESNRFIK